MANAKYKDWILETIDSLRKRKARPDIERICHMVKRKHGVAAAETEAELERLVDSEIVIKVDYKGSTSYRNAAKWRKSHLSGNVLNSAEATRILKNAVKKLTEEDGRNSGIGIREIEKFLTAQDHGTKFVKSHLQVALQREVGASRLLRLKNGNYSLSKESESPKKAGRPAKRKRIKKTHGPEFEQEPISKPNSKEAEEDDAMDTKCDYCLLTAECNRAGDTEDLLICKDCNAKAHPSCMNYSAKLAIRARMSPWQCFDCKTCFVCGDAGDADSLLFCDSCDKGYHMACHKPPVIKKPTGKWMCDTCVKEDPSNLNSDSATPATVTSESESECVEDNQKDKETVTADISVLPTPAETPEPVEATGPEPMEVDEKDATNGKSKDVAVKEEEKMEEEAQEEAEEEVEEEDKKDDPKKSASPKSDSSSPDVATPTAQTANLPEQSAKSGVPSDPANWTIKDVSNYFRNQGFPQQAHVFEEQEIDGKSLLLLKRSDVLTGLSLKLGPALKIYNFVKKLQTLNQPPSIYT